MKNETLHGSIVIYKNSEGRTDLRVLLDQETVWLSLKQMVDLFARDKSVISRHIKKIFEDTELERKLVVAFFATTAADGKTYQVEYFNLDVIIAVGYRVNSKQGTQFRQWATQLLKTHLVEGYTINQKRIQEKGLVSFQQTLKLLEKTLLHHELVNDIGSEVIKLINDYAKTWHWLLAYDEAQLFLPEMGKTSRALSYDIVKSAIESLKTILLSNQEASKLFGQERETGLKSILNNLEQTFSQVPLYKTPEEKAAHLLYFIIKDHPFVDGNKRIGCFVFLLYLEQNDLPKFLDDKGLTALALLIAESESEQKEILIRLIVNLMQG